MEVDIAQLEFIDQKLRTMAVELERDTGVVFTVTSIFRIDDPGVHGQLPCRGLDLRMRDPVLGKKIEEAINAKWAYDPDRPNMQCCLLHGEGRNMHLHLQVHPKTVRKG